MRPQDKVICLSDNWELQQSIQPVKGQIYTINETKGNYITLKGIGGLIKVGYHRSCFKILTGTPPIGSIGPVVEQQPSHVH